jgi:hypothetical protein
MGPRITSMGEPQEVDLDWEMRSRAGFPGHWADAVSP